MFSLVKKPTQKYKTLEELRLANVSWLVDPDKRNNPTFWPCFACQGMGKIRHEEDRDIIEGYKLAPWYKCWACGGDGRETKYNYQYRLKEEAFKYKIELRSWKLQVKAQRAALKKLTKVDRIALGLL